VSNTPIANRNVITEIVILRRMQLCPACRIAG